MNYCRRCGTLLTNLEKHIYKCKNEHIIFANSSPAVGVFFITPDNQVILSERGIEPHKGMLDAFGGFADKEESLEDAAIRELKEELNLEPSDYEELHYLCSSIGHYPYKEEFLPVISSLYWTRLQTSKELTPADDVASIHSIPLQDIDMNLLHDDDIRDGIRALQKLFLRK